jgi:release factor glutamine methyltransferase
MKSKELPNNIEEAELMLQREGFENPQLEARLLWSHVYNGSLKNDGLAHLREHVFQLYQGIPIQRQIGYTEVMGRKINIANNVLLPGPEIEILLGAFFDYAKNPKKVIDLCTGCGVLASIIGEIFPKAKVYATDISKKALDVARTNINFGDVELLQGDLFTPLDRNGVYGVDVLISNPPYCRTGDIAELPRQIRNHTPRIAIDGGEDGYFIHRRIIEGASKYIANNGLVILENEAGQSPELRRMLEERGYAIESTRKNVKGEERVIVVRRTE